jgi:hypothetical protein
MASQHARIANRLWKAAGDTQVTDRGTLQDHVDDLLEETSRLYKQVQRLEAAAERANERARYWSAMFDALNDVLNGEIMDDDDDDE